MDGFGRPVYTSVSRRRGRSLILFSLKPGCDHCYNQVFTHVWVNDLTDNDVGFGICRLLDDGGRFFDLVHQKWFADRFQFAERDPWGIKDRRLRELVASFEKNDDERMELIRREVTALESIAKAL